MFGVRLKILPVEVTLKRFLTMDLVFDLIILFAL